MPRKEGNETNSVAQFVSSSGAIVPSETVDFCDAESFNTYQGRGSKSISQVVFAISTYIIACLLTFLKFLDFRHSSEEIKLS